jgi:hypothetical protein
MTTSKDSLKGKIIGAITLSALCLLFSKGSYVQADDAETDYTENPQEESEAKEDLEEVSAPDEDETTATEDEDSDSGIEEYAEEGAEYADNSELRKIANDLSAIQDDTMLAYQAGVTHMLDLDLDGYEESVTYSGKGIRIRGTDYDVPDCTGDEFYLGRADNTILIVFECGDSSRIYVYDGNLEVLYDDIKGVPAKDVFIRNDGIFVNGEKYEETDE